MYQSCWWATFPIVIHWGGIELMHIISTHEIQIGTIILFSDANLVPGGDRSSNDQIESSAWIYVQISEHRYFLVGQQELDILNFSDAGGRVSVDSYKPDFGIPTLSPR